METYQEKTEHKASYMVWLFFVLFLAMYAMSFFISSEISKRDCYAMADTIGLPAAWSVASECRVEVEPNVWVSVEEYYK